MKKKLILMVMLFAFLGVVTIHENKVELLPNVYAGETIYDYEEWEELQEFFDEAEQLEQTAQDKGNTMPLFTIGIIVLVVFVMARMLLKTNQK